MKSLLNNNLTLVSVIIPCRNEEKYIGKCLDSIIAQDYPKDKFEVLVVDGMSEDDTQGIVENYVQKHSYIRLLDNPKKITPCAFNIGIRNAKGQIIMIMGVHAAYEKNYISKCVKYLEKFGVDNIGGIMKTLPGEKTIVAKAIALCLSHPFGVGNSYYRTGYFKKPKWVDTVFGGCYKKGVFEKVGLFNENMVRNQDYEFNLRLKKARGKILLFPEVVAYYYPKPNFKDSFWVTYPLKFGIKGFSWRHLVPLIFVLGLIG